MAELPKDESLVGRLFCFKQLDEKGGTKNEKAMDYYISVSFHFSCGKNSFDPSCPVFITGR